MPFTDFVEEILLSKHAVLEDEAQGRGVGGEYDKAPARFPRLGSSRA